jgi:CrcB protein
VIKVGAFIFLYGGISLNWNRVLIVGLGGFLGAALRYIVSGYSTKWFGDTFPFGTLAVNVAGGLLIGFIMEACTSLWPVPAVVRIFLTTGILGGLTTFSTFSYETLSLFSEGEFLMGGLNAGLNLFLALFACWGGRVLAQLL